MPCWVAIAPLMDSTSGWRHTEFTGRYPKTIRSPHRSITSAKAVKRSIVSLRARSRWQFPCVASGSDRSQFGPAKPNRSETHSSVGYGEEVALLERLRHLSDRSVNLGLRRHPWRGRKPIDRHEPDTICRSGDTRSSTPSTARSTHPLSRRQKLASSIRLAWLETTSDRAATRK